MFVLPMRVNNNDNNNDDDVAPPHPCRINRLPFAPRHAIRHAMYRATDLHNVRACFGPLQEIPLPDCNVIPDLNLYLSCIYLRTGRETERPRP